MRTGVAGARVCVTGAGGAIGGHLVKRLLADGLQVRAVDAKAPMDWWQFHDGVTNIRADLSRPEECRSAIGDCEQVFHLAADMGGIGHIEAHRFDCTQSAIITANMLVAARVAKVDRFFFSSSACVYNTAKQADPNAAALKESDAYPAQPEIGYGEEKLFGERMCQLIREDYGLSTRVARYHNVYGPHGSWSGGREKAPAAICRKAAIAVLTGSYRIKIWGTGEQTRSFMYVDDCVEGTLRLMASDVNEPINLGSSELVTINQLVDIVEDIASVQLERSYDRSAPQGVRGRNSDNTMIQERLGWQPSIPLRDGLEVTYRWVYDQARRSLDL